ncbi:MAG: pyridoxal phosphate-dependent aminotransferase, partial [Longimicrobiales bacterium]
AYVRRAKRMLRPQEQDYDALAKLANNENPYGPCDAAMEAMTGAFKYSNRYGYPDGGIVEAIAAHHGVEPDNILLGAGSGEILEVVGLTFLDDGRKVVGVEPSYSQVYRHATNIHADAILLPLLEDHTQDSAAMITATQRNYRDIGFVYLCNPNNPTGRVVPKQEVREILDTIPEDVPVLIDEAYHDYVDDPAYATSVPYVLEGRNVIVARTFSKIHGMAGMRIGYAIAPPRLIDRMRAYSTGTISALVKYGGVAALHDTASQQRVRTVTLDLRRRTAAALETLGYPVIPSETNFFMVEIRRPVRPVIDAFLKKGVLVGRPFPPMLEHLRVSIGTDEEMGRFMKAFGEIFEVTAASARVG